MNNERRKLVSEFFSKDDYLLNSSDRIKVRALIVKQYIGANFFSSVLDVGCGDGSLSLPFCARFDFLLLNDLSEQMLERCALNIQSKDAPKIKIFHGDIFDEKFPSLKFDLIVCIGVLAHVENPWKFLAMLDSLLNKDGIIIVETTEKPYPLGKLLSRVGVLDYSLKQDVSYSSYVKHRVAVLDLVNYFTKSGYDNVGENRFSIPLPGMSKWPQVLRFMYTLLTWKVPFLSRFGSEYIACFKKR